MPSRITYSKSIDIDAEWYRSVEFGIEGSPDDPIIDNYSYSRIIEDWQPISNSSIGITYKQMALIQSLLGYDDPFFQQTTAKNEIDKATFEQFREHLIYAKINYEWILAMLDGNMAYREISPKLKKIDKARTKLQELLLDFTPHFTSIQVRSSISELKFSDQSITGSGGAKNTTQPPDLSVYYQTIGVLDDLKECVDLTIPFFKSVGGGTYKFSKTWLILEAAEMYEEWHTEQFEAAISNDKHGKPTGPFVRFLDRIFKIFDKTYFFTTETEIRNSGLPREASSVLTRIRRKQPRGFHRQLNIGLHPNDYQGLLKILRSQRS